MFAKRFRLPNARAVKRLYAKGQRLSRPTALLLTVPNQARSVRVSVVCGRTVSRSAVVRNRLKRVARAVVQAQWPGLTERTDYLIVVRPPANSNEAVFRADLAALIATPVRARS